MNVFDILREKLEKQKFLNSYEPVNLGWNKAVYKVIEIVNEVEKEFVSDTNVGNNGWILVDERLPEARKRYLVSALWKDDTNDKLLPCPFCGGKAEMYTYEATRDIYDSSTLGYVDTEYFKKYGVYCTLCNCMMAE